MTEQNKFFVMCKVSDIKVDEDTGKLPPQWHVREFTTLYDAVGYFWEHKELHHTNPIITKNLNHITLNNVWEEAIDGRSKTM